MSNKTSIGVARIIGYTLGSIFRMAIFVGCVWASLSFLTWMGVAI
jgi:hypothetical protein